MTSRGSDGQPEPRHRGAEVDKAQGSEVAHPDDEPDFAADTQFGRLLGSLDGSTRAQVVAQMRSTSHRGPMPSAETLRAYRDIDPLLVTEVLAAAKENRHHRMRMDNKLVNTSRLSLLLCALVVLVALILAVVLGLNGQPILGGVFGATGMTPVVIAMVRGGGNWTGRGGA